MSFLALRLGQITITLAPVRQVGRGGPPPPGRPWQRKRARGGGGGGAGPPARGGRWRPPGGGGGPPRPTLRQKNECANVIVINFRFLPVRNFSDQPRRSLGCGQHPIGFIVVDELLCCRIPAQRALELLGHAAQQ